MDALDCDAERKKRLGDAVRTLRSRSRLSQAKLAREVAVDLKTIQRIEGGRQLPNLGLIEDLAQFFECSLDQVAGWQPLPEMESTGALVSRLAEVEQDMATVVERGEFVDEAVLAILTALARSAIVQQTDGAQLSRLLDQLQSRRRA